MIDLNFKEKFEVFESGLEINIFYLQKEDFLCISLVDYGSWLVIIKYIFIVLKNVGLILILKKKLKKFIYVISDEIFY